MLLKLLKQYECPTCSSEDVFLLDTQKDDEAGHVYDYMECENSHRWEVIRDSGIAEGWAIKP